MIHNRFASCIRDRDRCEFCNLLPAGGCIKQIHLYPYDEKENPKPRGYITPDGNEAQSEEGEFFIGL